RTTNSKPTSSARRMAGAYYRQRFFTKHCAPLTGRLRASASVLILKFAASPFFVTPAKAGVHPAVDTGLRRYDESEGRRSDPANFRFRTLGATAIRAGEDAVWSGDGKICRGFRPMPRMTVVRSGAA